MIEFLFKEWNCATGKRYFDPIRKLFVCITPEEIVRQRMIAFLQNSLNAPVESIHIEDHLIHYGIEDFNGRMDIVLTYMDESQREHVLTVIECKEERICVDSMQVIQQAIDYASRVKARYVIVVNGIDLQFYHLESEGSYKPIQGILNYDEMIRDVHIYEEECLPFQRLSYHTYFDLESLRKYNWYSAKIGEDTPKQLVPCIINFDDYLLDTTKTLSHLTSTRFSLIEDLGIQYRQYNDASGGGFGSGGYRVFLVNDNMLNYQFLTGFAVMATGKTVNDPTYGTSDGKSVLVIMYNDGNVDEMSVQINLNKFLLTDEKTLKATFLHNGVVTRKGASKQDLFNYIDRYSKHLVQNGKINFGTIDYSRSLMLILSI